MKALPRPALLLCLVLLLSALAASACRQPAAPVGSVWQQIDDLEQRARPLEISDPAAAVAIYQQVVELNQGSLHALQKVVELSFALGDYERVRLLGPRAIRLARSNNDVFLEQVFKNLLASVQSRDGESGKLDQVFTATILSSNGSYMGCAWQGLGELYAQIDPGARSAPSAGLSWAESRRTALDAFVAGDAQGTLSVLDAFAASGKDAGDGPQDAESHEDSVLLRSLALTTLRRYEEAEKALEVLRPESPTRAVAQGHLFLATMQPDKALAQLHLDSAASSGPMARRMRLLGLGWLSANAAQHEAAIAWFDQVVQHFPSDTFGLLGRANSQLALQQYEGARADYLIVREQNPRNRHALAGLASVDLAQGRLSEAESGFHAAIKESNGRFTCPYEGLGLVFLKRGAREEAAQWFEQAIDANPSIDHVKYTRLAEILMEEGRLDEAERLLERALHNKPGDADATEVLRRLAALRAR